jgi:serine/threonine protein kinase
MPLSPGSLSDLAPLSYKENEPILLDLALQMLAALDYLASQGLCHRDVKPDNILFEPINGRYKFLLADFGLVNLQQLTNTWCAGTPIFMAPEIYFNGGAGVGPKADVWSLFVTFISVIKEKQEKFNTICGQDVRSPADFPKIFAAVRDVAKTMDRLQLMAHEDPLQRASAAAMLVLEFKGKGLTTPRHEVVLPHGAVVATAMAATPSPPANTHLGNMGVPGPFYVNAPPPVTTKVEPQTKPRHRKNKPGNSPAPNGPPSHKPLEYQIRPLPNDWLASEFSPLTPQPPRSRQEPWRACPAKCGGFSLCIYCPKATERPAKEAPSSNGPPPPHPQFGGITTDSLGYYNNRNEPSEPQIFQPFAYEHHLGGGPLDSIPLHHRRLGQPSPSRMTEAILPNMISTPHGNLAKSPAGFVAWDGVSGPPFVNPKIENHPYMEESDKEYYRKTGFFAQGYLFGIDAPRS